MLTLIEKAQDAFDEEKAQELEHRIRSQQFTLNDYLDQFAQLKKMGPLSDVMGDAPGPAPRSRPWTSTKGSSSACRPSSSR